jgi:2'-5' RNA ligase
VLTLVLDEASQAVLDDRRRAHFPPERNHLAAHVTLFHALPGEHLEVVQAGLAAAAGARGRFAVEVAGVRPLGRGVAYDLAAPELLALRATLAQRWAGLLTRQDAAGFRPHVTVQNKVHPDVARALLAELRAGFSPWTATAEGLALWWYRGGPWEHIRTWPFPRR